MNIVSNKRFTLGLAALGLAMLATPLAQAAGARHLRTEFAPISLVGGQGARISLVNLTDPSSNGRLPPDPVRVLVRYFDAAGEPIGSLQSVALGAGESRLVPGPSIPPSNLSGNPVLVRATILIPPDPVKNAIQANFEVHSVSTGGTLLVNPGVIRGFNPQPDPPGFEATE